VGVHQLDAVPAQRADRLRDRARVPGGEPQLDHRHVEAAQPGDGPPVARRAQHNHDGLDGGVTGDGCEVDELVARIVAECRVTGERGDEVSDLHETSLFDVAADPRAGAVGDLRRYRRGPTERCGVAYQRPCTWGRSSSS
jgi:hypothetical protein